MIDPITRTKTITNNDPLPPAWLRIAPTKPDDDALTPQGIHRVGPAGRLHKALVALIDSAREVILIASFLLADQGLADALLRAADRGVRVYVLTASETHLAKLPREDNEFDQRMIKEHKDLLDRLVGRVLLRSADHFHAKFLLVDPATFPHGILSTANFNKALKEGVELGIELAPKAVQTLAAWFAHAFWSEAKLELGEKGRLADVRPPPALPILPTDLTTIVPTTKSHNHLKSAVLHLIRSARRRLVVASYGLDADHESIQALLERARAGVEIIILTRPRLNVLPAISALAIAGARVLAHDKLHAKAIHSDAGALIMTANLEKLGLDTGLEIGVLLGPGPAAALGTILDAWIAASPWRFAENARPSDHLGEIWLADRSTRDPRATIVEKVEVTAPSVTAADALALDKAPEPVLTPHREPNTIPRRTVYTWKVEPPKLPKKATQELRTTTSDQKDKDGKITKIESKVPYNPPVYRLGQQRFVLVTRAGDLAAARKLADQLGATVVVS
jgi:cardiolipin synthase